MKKDHKWIHTPEYVKYVNDNILLVIVLHYGMLIDRMKSILKGIYNLSLNTIHFNVFVYKEWQYYIILLQRLLRGAVA